MKPLSMLAAVFVVLTLWSGLAPAEPSSEEELRALRSEIEALKEGQDEIRRDLEEIKALLQGRARAGRIPSRPIVVSVEGDPYNGSPTAPVTIVEFSDYQCPFCARHVRDTLPKLEREYVDTGKVKYVFRDFPLTSIHPHAFKAAEAANCAGDQGKYWEMHDQLFANRIDLAEDKLNEHASAVGLFQACLNSDRMAGEIREDLEDGQKAGVRGTPTFFIGRTDPSSSQMKTLFIVRGAKPYATFQKAFDSLLTTP